MNIHFTDFAKEVNDILIKIWYYLYVLLEMLEQDQMQLVNYNLWRMIKMEMQQSPYECVMMITMEHTTNIKTCMIGYPCSVQIGCYVFFKEKV